MHDYKEVYIYRYILKISKSNYCRKYERQEFFQMLANTTKVMLGVGVGVGVGEKFSFQATNFRKSPFSVIN